MSHVLLLAAVLAQAADAATWTLLPPGAERNVLIANLHAPAGWALKGALVVLVLALAYALPRVRSRRGWPLDVTWAGTVAVNRQAAELVAVLAVAVGCVGAGANLSVLVVA